MLEVGIKPVYVFDGKSPNFKVKELEVWSTGVVFSLLVGGLVVVALIFIAAPSRETC